MIFKQFFVIYSFISVSYVTNSKVEDDYTNVTSVLKDTNSEKNEIEELNNKNNLTEIKALNLSNTQIIGDFEDNKMIINCPFGNKKSDYYYIKWFIGGKQISHRQLRKRTNLRMTFKDNQILVKYLRPEDTDVYSCQLRMRNNSTIEELANNSTNFKLIVYEFSKTGLDPRSPKVVAKFTFLLAFTIFCVIIFEKFKINS